MGRRLTWIERLENALDGITHVGACDAAACAHPRPQPWQAAIDLHLFIVHSVRLPGLVLQVERLEHSLEHGDQPSSSAPIEHTRPRLQ